MTFLNVFLSFLRPLRTDINFFYGKMSKKCPLEHLFTIDSKLSSYCERTMEGIFPFFSRNVLVELLMAKKLKTLEFALHAEIPCSAPFVLRLRLKLSEASLNLHSQKELRTVNRPSVGPSKLR